MESAVVLYTEMFMAIHNLVGRKVRTKLEVNLWGDIYNKYKQGTVSRICIDKNGTRVLVLFKWKTMRGYQQQELWINFYKLEFYPIP